MSQSVKSESPLKPIENILESLKGKSSENNYTTTSLASKSSSFSVESTTSSLGFKVVIFLVVLLAGIIGYTYLEKEVNEWIANIKNYFETKKYTNEEKEKQKEIEKEKEKEKEQTTEDIIKDAQSDIKKNKKQKKEKKEKEKEPVNYSASSKLNSSPVQDDVEEYQKDTLQKALNDASQSGGEVIPDASESRIQSGKSGWCFIGAEGLSRTCAEIGVNDMCMSGEIYPTKDVCINPNLRA